MPSTWKVLPELLRNCNSYNPIMQQAADTTRILPSAAGPSSSLANSPSAQFASRFPGDNGPDARPGGSSETKTRSGSGDSLDLNLKRDPSDPGIAGGSSDIHGSAPGPTGVQVDHGTGQVESAGWAEYLPTFMHSDGFDGWDGSMLLPGFGRGQITLGGGLLHSQFGSGIM